MFRMLVVLMIVVLCVHTAAALPGSGTQQDPWRIESLADFDEFAADPNYWSGFTRLETDVNLAGRTYTTAVIAPDIDPFSPFRGTAFTGVFDGNDHKITNLTIDDGGPGNNYLGLFGCIGDGEVKNLGLESVFVDGTGDCVGGLVGRNSGSISNCYSTCDVNSLSDVGGLVGGNYGSVSNCYSTGSVRGAGNGVGGLVGGNSWGSVSNCYSTGNVNGVEDVGGLVGWNYYGTVLNCYSTGSVNGTGTAYYVGGLVGWNYDGGSVSNCYSTGDVNGNEDVGGLVGANSGTISDCYSTGDVNGTDWGVGGLVGHNGLIKCRPMEGCSYLSGYIYNSYSIGSVQGNTSVGGLVGYNEVGDIERSFWDVETSSEPNMCGGQTEYASGCDPNCGKTTAQMQTKSTFTSAGWDFVEIWGIGENQTYPYLRFAPAGEFNYDKKVDLFDLAILASHWLEGITP